MDVDFEWGDDFLDDALLSAGAMALGDLLQTRCGMAPREADKLKRQRDSKRK